MIKRHPSDKPLFLYLSYQAPHMPFTGQDPPSQYMDLYKNSSIYQRNLRQDISAVPRAAAISVGTYYNEAFLDSLGFVA